MGWFSTCQPPSEVFPSSVGSDTLARDEWPWSSQRAGQARSGAASRSAMIGTITLKVHGKDKPFPVKDGKVDNVPLGRKTQEVEPWHDAQEWLCDRVAGGIPEASTEDGR